MATLAEIRAKLQSMEPKQDSNRPKFQGDNAMYPFWNIPEGATATMRFLPDGDPNNTFFWTERNIIRLEFPGVVGASPAEQKKVTVQVPCGEIYGDTCPVLTEVRPWYKDDTLKQQAGKYWKKRSYIFQGFVTSNPLEEEAPENPIRRFIIGPQIFQIIKQALMDPDMEELPTDYTAGVDFRLNKTSKGGYADYSTSNWARRERPLDDAEMQAVNTHGLFNLSDFLPKKPTDVELKVMQEMFEASVDGEAYDADRWSNYFRPAGMAARTGDPNTASSNGTATSMTSPEPTPAPAVEAAPTPTPEATPEPAKEEPAAASSDGTDILAMIRARQGQ